jgi:hypothetical protein
MHGLGFQNGHSKLGPGSEAGAWAQSFMRRAGVGGGWTHTPAMRRVTVASDMCPSASVMPAGRPRCPVTLRGEGWGRLSVAMAFGCKETGRGA